MTLETAHIAPRDNLQIAFRGLSGMLMSSYKSVTKPEQLVRLWCHESKRVFEDRLINADDHTWFRQLLQGIVRNNFQMEWEDVVPQVIAWVTYCGYTIESAV